MRVNVDAAYLTTWAVKDDMIAAGGGAIVNISSLASRSPKPDTVGYAASKSALEGFSRGCAAAFVRHGIRVNTVVPGLVLTPRAATVGDDVVRQMTAEVPMRRAGDPTEIAATVCFLLSDAAGYITGEAIVASGGQH
jgi:acetoacetyl-CoA reductase